MKLYKNILLAVLLVFSGTVYAQQTVGLVLSGGGIDALAHVGVIKALEENNIPIDYITGTSMGALIGAMYASGYTPEEMETFFLSQSFKDAVTGELDKKDKYFFPVEDPEPVMIPLRLVKDPNVKALLPSKIIPSESADFLMFKYLEPATVAAGFNFDSLMIPFRCIAADIIDKKEKVFKEGSLNIALRASMSYPLFIRPIEVDGHLMYDGGIYNNFPSNVMCIDFHPDVVIGSNVSENIPMPSSEDLISQLKSIVTRPSNFEILCGQGILIEPKNNFGTFNIDKIKPAIDSGYYETLKHIDEIKKVIGQRDNLINEKRQAFRNKLAPLEFTEVEITGLPKGATYYTEKALARIRKKDSVINVQRLQKNALRLYQEPYVNDVFPKVVKSNSQKGYAASISIKPRKSVTLSFGGYLSQRPLSTGFFGISYSNLSKIGINVNSTIHFGRFYNSGKAAVKIEVPSRLPLYLRPMIIVNRWNWFESRRANLFTDDKPNYVIEEEYFTGLETGFGLGNHYRLELNGYYFNQRNKYYQTKNFTPSDTTDKTLFNGYSFQGFLKADSRNYPQYATKGRYMEASARFVAGREHYFAGSTSPKENDYSEDHRYVVLKLTYDRYFDFSKRFKVGMLLEGVYSGQIFFRNYMSTVLQAPAFKPTPDSKTMFLESFHANRYIAEGLRLIYLPFKNFQIRAEAYFFQPYQAYVQNDDGTAGYDDPWNSNFTILSGQLVYNTFLGPISASVNYYYNTPEVSLEGKEPVTFLLHFGYILFNRRAYLP